MSKLLSFREEGWDFGGHGQREWQGRDWNTGSRPAGVGSRGLAMDRLEDNGSIREPRAEREELALAGAQEAVELLTGGRLGCSISVSPKGLRKGRFRTTF